MFIDPEMDWQAGMGWGPFGPFGLPDSPHHLWRDPDWRPWAEDFMGQLPWRGTGVVDVDVDDLVEACERYCLAAGTEAIPITKIGKWLWAAKGPLTKLFIKGAPKAVTTFGPRIFSRQAKRTLAKRFEGLVKKGNKVRPSVSGTAQSGAQLLRASQYDALGQALNERFRVDPADFATRLVERIQRRAGEDPSFEDFLDLEYEEYSEMAYGRRAWVPYHIWKRRQRRNYGRGGYRGGYSGYPSRRRTYRRW